jgi:tRNA (mo5U34)-methyltransferase
MARPNLAAEVARTSWYHTLELPGGLVTPGYFDTRPSLSKLPLPNSLEGKRCLDVGTSDGFWAFEMERRGASEVIAVDIDDPADYDWPEPIPVDTSRPANPQPGVNPGFAIAHEALGSEVERVNVSVYELPSASLGKFDFVFMGALMIHLRDPVKALSAIRQVTAGLFLSTDSISVPATLTHPLSAAASLCGQGQPRWWTPNLIGYRRMIEAAGFKLIRSGGPYFLPFGRGFPERQPLRHLPLRQIPGRIVFDAITRRFGAPSAWALCDPNQEEGTAAQP